MKPARAVGVVLLLAASSANARNAGIFGQSGRPGGSACASCHANNQPAPTITVTGLDVPLVEGDSVLFTITVHSNDLAGADDDLCPGRCGGFCAGVVNGVGEFVDGPDTRLPTTGLPSQITHSTRKQMTDGDASWELELGVLAPGDHVLYVAVKDVDGSNTSSGDRGATAQFPFHVDDIPDAGREIFDAGDPTPAEGEGEGEGEGEDPVDAGFLAPGGGGCDCGGASQAGALLALAALRRPTRRTAASRSDRGCGSRPTAATTRRSPRS